MYKSPIEKTQESSYITSPSIPTKYDQETINRLQKMINVGYDYDPQYQLGHQIWQALNQLKYQNFIDYQLPNDWRGITWHLFPKPGHATMKLKFPTNVTGYNDIIVKFFNKIDGSDNNFVPVLALLVEQATANNATKLIWKPSSYQETQMMTQTSGDLDNVIERIRTYAKNHGANI